ncbi:DNA mismatch repair protein Msh6 [Camellia lanceoleosa]|uniref:DNA mismatch repair protein Msh6 n=1 Tax=Camellia lanceoleosa TaxID=1840588 RepID=A0ACC0I8H4_9ERIC|nr:DNA mismatch repair protein Msh6 [Camellia lanceoleosa]
MNNNNIELDRKTDLIGGESQSIARVSGDAGVVSSDSRAGIVGSFEKEINGANDGDKSVDLIGFEENRISTELENRAPESDGDGRVSVGDNSESEETRVSLVDWKGVDEEMKSRASDIRNEDVIQMVNDNKMVAKNSGSEQWTSRVEETVVNSAEKEFVELSPRANDLKCDTRNGGLGKGHGVSQSDLKISMSDEFAANEKCKAIGAGQSSSVGYGYEIGDMVWGKVKSHPWWPGHIYNEAFASPLVRRSKRPGHVLVAFFGDSSYGWFDPAELIPFDANFSEKSRQTNSRTFIKAVEEAIDEASRIRCLALACRCRNAFNFRPTEVEGYFAVDLSDHEPEVVYPVSQIGKARESFRPKDTLAFMKQLALMPTSDECSGLDFIMNKTVALAYRKAVFEEFDETYAQAFGAQPVRPCREPMKAVAQTVRAPLSGPMVFAEALGKKKNTSKPNKAKDQPTKDKYLFKRRDELNELKIQQMGQTTSSMQPAYVVGSVELAAGDYVLQKRAPAPSVKQQTRAKLEQMVAIGMDGGSVSSQDATGEKVVALADPRVTNASGLSGKGTFHGGIDHVLLTSEPEGDATINLEHYHQSETPLKLYEGFQQPPSLPAIVEEVHEQEQVHIGGNGGRVLPTIETKFHGLDSRNLIDTEAKKAKLFKDPVGELGAEKSVSGEKKKKKKKKRKKEMDLEMSSDRTQKRAATGKVGASIGRVTEKSVHVGLPPRDDFQIEHRRKDDGASRTLLPDSLRTQPTDGIGNIEIKLSHLLGDLKAIALDPFDGVEMNGSETIQRAFLKFRSVVYQKSLALLNPAEIGSDNPPHENIKVLPSLKPPKPLFRPSDLTKGGRKRGPSDRQEELTAKRVKKINDMKSLAAEKKTAQKDGKETLALPKPLKPDLARKTESTAKSPDPTMLVMKFPPETTLPSGSELKARLARFGPLDHSSTRIFWQSSTCRVVFIHRVDAEAAHRHVAGNNALFGNVNVRCHIRLLGASVAPESESKVQKEDAHIETRDSSFELRPPPPPPAQQPSVQLKSCLKKPMGDEAGPTGSKVMPRVKFAVKGESSDGGENLMVGNKINFNASFGDDGTISSSNGIDFNSKNFQIPAQFPRNSHNFNTFTTPALAPAPVVPRASNMDIAQKMLSLLTKCNEVVTNVRSSLGYVPYYSL